MSSATPEPSPATRQPLTLLPLIALIFYDVSGGPFGIEPSVSAGGGPLLPILGFLILPLIWSLPEALITAELSSALPSNGGYVVWIESAFERPFWSFQVGFLKWLSGTLDNALYPVLFLDYISKNLAFGERFLLLCFITSVLTYLNYRGLHLVGISAIFLTVFSLLPFVIMSLLSVPKIKPARWIKFDRKNLDLRAFFNSMFWNLNYWDKASTLAGEVDNPTKTFPKAIFCSMFLVILSYLIPLLSGTGSLNESKNEEWTDGYFNIVGLIIGGKWLQIWIQISAALSNMGLFEAEMSCDSFQLLGMSELGMIPSVFSKRSKYGTPTYSILLSGSGIIILSCMSFQQIIEFLNFLYALGMLLEFLAFIKLRFKSPNLERPYKIPLGKIGAVLICIPPSILLILVMCLASRRTFLVSGIVVFLGFVLYFVLEKLKEKKWVDFVDVILEKDGINEEVSLLDAKKEELNEGIEIDKVA